MTMAKLSWIVLAFKSLVMILIFQGIAIMFYAPLVLLAIPAIIFSVYIDYQFNYIEVVDNKINLKTGFLKKRSKEITFDKVESVEITQTILGEILNFGDISISGTGTNSLNLKGISNPKEFKKSLEKL